MQGTGQIGNGFGGRTGMSLCSGTDEQTSIRDAGVCAGSKLWCFCAALLVPRPCLYSVPDYPHCLKYSTCLWHCQWQTSKCVVNPKWARAAATEDYCKQCRGLFQSSRILKFFSCKASGVTSKWLVVRTGDIKFLERRTCDIEMLLLLFPIWLVPTPVKLTQ